MGWLKRNLWKIGIILVGGGLLLAWMVWISLSVAGGQPGRNPAIQTGIAQPIPTANATALTVDVLKQQDDKLQRDNSFPWDILNVMSASLGTTLVALAAFISALIGIGQWQGNRKLEQGKRAEERFQAAVTGFGDEKEGARIGAAILLRTFLRPGYEQFYTQTFDLVVANLRLPRASRLPEEDPDALHSPPQVDPDTPQSLTTLSQALIMVFMEAFPLVRRQRQGNPQSLDATGVQLDNAYLVAADLKQIWMPRASLREADLMDARLDEANLRKADLSGAKFRNTDLSRVDLVDADLSRANLSGALHFKDAKLKEVLLDEVRFKGAILNEANLSGMDLSGMDLSGMRLREATLCGATLLKTNFSWADLSGIDFRKTHHFKGAILVGARMTHAICPEMDLSELNLTRTTLEYAYLYEANLSRTNLWNADLREANLEDADLREANLEDAKLLRTNLEGADLRGANLEGVIVRETDFTKANLTGLDLTKTREFRQPILREAILEGANLSGLDFSGADLSEAKLCGANLYEADLKYASSLEKADLRGVKDLKKEQREFCKASGAFVDEDLSTSSPQSPAATSPSEPSNDTLASSTPPTQGSLPTSDAGESSVVSSQQEPES